MSHRNFTTYSNLDKLNRLQRIQRKIPSFRWTRNCTKKNVSIFIIFHCYIFIVSKFRYFATVSQWSVCFSHSLWILVRAKCLSIGALCSTKHVHTWLVSCVQYANYFLCYCRWLMFIAVGSCTAHIVHCSFLDYFTLTKPSMHISMLIYCVLFVLLCFFKFTLVSFDFTPFMIFFSLFQNCSAPKSTHQLFRMKSQRVMRNFWKKHQNWLGWTFPSWTSAITELFWNYATVAMSWTQRNWEN